MSWKNFYAKGKLKVMLLTAGATLLATVLFLNFSLGENHVQQEIPHLYSIEDPQFQRSLGVMLGPPITEGNRFTALINGDQIFPKMLQAIRNAQKTILFETYIYWSGDIGKQFAGAVGARPRRRQGACVARLGR